MTKKIQITITISKDLVDWIDREKDNTARFSSRSHAVEHSLTILRNAETKSGSLGLEN